MEISSIQKIVANLGKGESQETLNIIRSGIRTSTADSEQLRTLKESFLYRFETFDKNIGLIENQTSEEQILQASSLIAQSLFQTKLAFAKLPESVKRRADARKLKEYLLQLDKFFRINITRHLSLETLDLVPLSELKKDPDHYKEECKRLRSLLVDFSSFMRSIDDFENVQNGYNDSFASFAEFLSQHAPPDSKTLVDKLNIKFKLGTKLTANKFSELLKSDENQFKAFIAKLGRKLSTLDTETVREPVELILHIIGLREKVKNLDQSSDYKANFQHASRLIELNRELQEKEKSSSDKESFLNFADNVLSCLKPKREGLRTVEWECRNLIRDKGFKNLVQELRSYEFIQEGFTDAQRSFLNKIYDKYRPLLQSFLYLGPRDREEAFEKNEFQQFMKKAFQQSMLEIFKAAQEGKGEPLNTFIETIKSTVEKTNSIPVKLAQEFVALLAIVFLLKMDLPE